MPSWEEKKGESRGGLFSSERTSVISPGRQAWVKERPSSAQAACPELAEGPGLGRVMKNQNLSAVASSFAGASADRSAEEEALTGLPNEEVRKRQGNRKQKRAGCRII